jgi:DNA-binding NtrC family response regulator
MKRILVSWMAYKNDFTNQDGVPKVNEEGTTASFHRYFFNKQYEKHILLSSGKEGQIRMDFLLNYLHRTFPDHVIEPYYFGDIDVISLEQILSKIYPLLTKLKSSPLDLFISPGTPTMQTAWYLAHWSSDVDTRLLQVRPKEFTKSRKRPELEFVEIEKDTTTYGAMVRQAQNERPANVLKDKGFLKTESILPVYDKAYKVALAADATVLIVGDTGTGKEHLARFIHDESPRRNADFHAVNCSALGDELLESRLFGYKKGAFTGAEKDTKGIIESTNGGTIFLDEIGDISRKMQQALLRVLQEKEITPIGGKPKNVDVRFVSATNKDLLTLCEKGEFRWDLYYRLSVVDLQLPSLQERGIKELKELIHFFIGEKKKKFKTANKLRISKEVMEKLLAYPFPGNIRELENLIERFYVLSPIEEVLLKDLPPRILYAQNTDSLLLVDAEKKHIKKVLRLNKGKQKKTARDIGVAYNTLMKKIKEYGIDINTFKI